MSNTKISLVKCQLTTTPSTKQQQRKLVTWGESLNVYDDNDDDIAIVLSFRNNR